MVRCVSIWWGREVVYVKGKEYFRKCGENVYECGLELG